MKIGYCLLVTALSAFAYADGLPVEAVQDGSRVSLRVGGVEFAVYRADADQKYPYIWPVNGPLSGESVTTQSSEPYPHHHSLFFACDRVNGGNYWQEENARGQIVSQALRIVEPSGAEAVLEDDCVWRIPGEDPIIRDVRRVTVSAPSEGVRYIDFDIALEALTDITIEKTNHSLFAARVMPEISVASGGTLVNAEGQSAESGTFGQASAWMDYSGTRRGVTEGIAILQHPANPWYPNKWFTRDYGFFSPTPMYWLDNDRLEWPKGETKRFRYRVVVHAGNAQEAELSKRYAAYQADD